MIPWVLSVVSTYMMSDKLLQTWYYQSGDTQIEQNAIFYQFLHNLVLMSNSFSWSVKECLRD